MNDNERELAIRIKNDERVSYRGSEGLEACKRALAAELGPAITAVETEIRER